MSKDIIYREDAIEAIRDVVTPLIPTLYGAGIKAPLDCEMALRTLPSADRPQGEWIYGEHNVAMCDGYRCNRCDFFVPWDYEHKFIDLINDYHFCPNCGCRMKGADDE